MTNLELLICEAENNGEISIDIRDRLLEVMEATKYKEMQDKTKEDIEKLKNEKDSKIKKYETIYNTTDSSSVKKKCKEKIENIKEEYNKKIEQKEELLKNLTGDDVYNFKGSSKKHGNLAAINKDKSPRFASACAREGRIRNIKDKQHGIQTDDKTSKLEKKPKGLFTKESVDELRELIYESELSGEITAEERALLLLELE